MRCVLLIILIGLIQSATPATQTPRGNQTFPKLGPKTTAAAVPPLPPLPPGFTITTAPASTNCSLSIKRTNNKVCLRWTGPNGSVFQLMTRTNVNAPWINVGTGTTNRSATVPMTKGAAFYKVVRKE